jgi:hypothetical protein
MLTAGPQRRENRRGMRHRSLLVLALLVGCSNSPDLSGLPPGFVDCVDNACAHVGGADHDMCVTDAEDCATRHGYTFTTDCSDGTGLDSAVLGQCLQQTGYVPTSARGDATFTGAR